MGFKEVGTWVLGAPVVTTGACDVGLNVDGAWVTTAAVGEWDVGLNEVGIWVVGAAVATGA